MRVRTSDEVVEQLEDTAPMTGMSARGHGQGAVPGRRTERVIGLQLVAPRPRPPDAEDAADDDVGGQEEQDHALQDVDHLDRHAGLDLHQRRAGAQGTDEQRREQDADRVGASQQGHGDGLEADVGGVRRRDDSRSTPRISMAPARPASRPPTVRVSAMTSRGRMPA